MLFELGNGKSHHANHTRPMWITGKIPAHITAKMVMASAARLMDVRQRWRNRKRIAEMSVPAWPMEHVPHQWRAELRPDAVRVGQRKEPPRKPHAPDVDHRENPGAHYRKDGH